MLDKTKYKIIFSNKLPQDGEGIVIHYEYATIKVKDWISYDVRNVVSKFEDDWLVNIESWHRRISDQATKLTKWWWLYQGSRLIVWQTVSSFSLKPILFSLAIIEISNQNPKKNIYVLAANEELITYICEWADRYNKRIVESSKTINKFNSFFINLKQNGLLLLNIFKKTLFYILIILLQKRQKVEETSVLVHSSIISNQLLDSNGDHYFGTMLDKIKSLGKKDVTWLYNDLRINKKLAYTKLDKLNRQAYFNTDLFRLSDVLFGLYEGIKSYIPLKKLIKIENMLEFDSMQFSEFPKIYIRKLVLSSIPIYELMLYRQFSRLLNVTKATRLIYPYEEKPIERAMLLAVKDSNISIKTIAFAHGGYSKGHLYIKRECKNEPPRADLIAVTGDAQNERFHQLGIPKDQLVIVGSPRYVENEMDFSNNKENFNRILLICGFGFELRIFASFLVENRNILNGYKLTVRRSPHSWVKEQDDAEKMLRDAGIEYNVESKNLFDQIDESDIVFFESTTAALIAVLRGKLAVRLNLNDIISTQHFYGKFSNGEFKYRKELKDLKLILDEFCSLTRSEYIKRNKEQRETIKHLYSPIDSSAVNKLLGNV